MRVLSLLLICLSLSAQNTRITRSGKITAISGNSNLATPGATNTQMIMSYVAPDSTPCTWKVSESPSLTPLIHDVDTSLFSGSNSDARAEGYSSGTTRVFVIGKRRAERGTNGFWYSRAMQVNTLHYYEKTCASGANVTTGTFRTANILLGNTYSDPLPGDFVAKPYYTGLGFYAWPQFTKWDTSDPTAKSETLIDTQTGFLTKRIQFPNDEPITYFPPAGNHDFDTAVGSAWVNPSNVRNDDTSSTTYSGTTSDWLFVSDSQYNYGSESITLSLKAWCSVGACSGENSKIEACFTINGSTCWPSNATAKIQEVSLGTSALPSSFVTLGTTVPILDSWTPAGYTPPTVKEVALLLGFADVSAGGVVTFTGSSFPNQTYFNPNWTPNISKINLGSSVCTITAMTSLASLTVNPAACTPALTVPVSSTAYTGTSTGFLIRKKTNTTDQINIQYARFATTTSVGLDWPASGSAEFCSEYITQNSVTGENGYHCAMIATGIDMLYWISRDSGTANYLGLFQVPAVGGTDGYGGSCPNGGRTFIGTVPSAAEHFYCTQYDNSVPAKTVLIDCVLTTTNQTGNQSVSCTNLTPTSLGKNLLALMTSFTASDTPSFNSAIFGCNINGRQGTKLVGNCQRSVQDTIGWTFMFDPNLTSSAAGCVGGGRPGCIVAAMSTWGHAPVRWCVNHTPFVAGDTDIVWTAGKYLADFGNLGDGPYLSNITSGSIAGADGALAPGVGFCPAGTLRCDTVVVDGEPCDETPQTGEAAASPCAKNATYVGLIAAAVGDVFITSQLEWVVLANKNGNSWTLQRGMGHRGARAGANTVLNAYCSCVDFAPSEYTNWSWNWDTAADPHATNTSGTAIKIAWDYSHVNPDPQVTLGGNPYWDNVNCPTGACYGIRTTGAIGDEANIRVTESPKFAGVGGPTAYVERAQDHPSWLQKKATPAEKLWFTDARPFAPQPDISGTFALVSGQLYKATSSTSDGDNLSLIGGAGATLGGLNRKLVATVASCGAQPMQDISSSATGNVIGTTSSDQAKYCIARKVNECRTGSAPGDVYANCTNQFQQYSPNFTCRDQNQSLYNDFCFANMDGYLMGVNQMGFATADPTGLLGRQLTKGYEHWKLANGFWNAQAFADGSWIMFPGRYGILLGKLPPFPAADSIVRTTFVPQVVTVPTVGGTDNAIIQFGYAENGDPANYYCMSRQEKCMVAASTVQTIPFSFPSDGAGGVETGLTGQSCVSGCQIAIPGISQRVLYYQIKYRNSSNATIQTDPVAIINVR